MKSATINFDNFLIDFETAFPQYLGCIYSVFDADDRGVIKDNGVYLDNLATNRFGLKQKNIWEGFNNLLTDRIGFAPEKIYMVNQHEMYAETVA